MAIYTHYSSCLCLSNTRSHTHRYMLFISFSWYLSSRDLQQSLRPAVWLSWNQPPTSSVLVALMGIFPVRLQPDVRRGVGEKARNRHHCLSRTGDKASPACPGLCLSLVSGCGGCATERHTWHSDGPVKKQLRQRWDGGVWAQSCLVIPGWFTHWGWVAEDT